MGRLAHRLRVFHCSPRKRSPHRKIAVPSLNARMASRYSYYGAATGRWDERPLTESESIRSEWGEVTGNLYLNERIFHLNERIFLANIPREIWRYELGGYPILKKWLGYRQANRRTSAALSLLELDNLRTIELRIAALLVVRPLLDVAYSKAILAARRRLGHPME
jgi:hypothetical protein